MRLAGVIGFPVGHSRSPAMHNAAFRELGLEWRYMRLPVPSARFDETVRALPGSGYRGANVTVPHKLAAHALADTLSEAARAVGAVNTLTFEGGAIAADNTDAGGLLDALAEPVRGLRALVLGAGGAGRAAAWALRDAGAGEVLVWNRTPWRAEDLAQELGVGHAAAAEPVDLLVNATTIGLDPALDWAEAVDALGLTGLDPPRTVVDLVYGSHVTPVCEWAASAGSRVVDGIEVLVRQGARSFEAWTGCAPPLEVMRTAARGRRPEAR